MIATHWPLLARLLCWTLLVACRDDTSIVVIEPWTRDAVHILGGTFRGTPTFCPAPADFAPRYRDELSGEWREGILRPVYLHTDAFLIDRRVVTCDEWAQCVRAKQCKPIKQQGCLEGIVAVRFEEAAKYCAFRGGTLPSTKELQRALRGTDGHTYPDGATSDLRTCERPTFRGDPYDRRCLHRSPDGVEYATLDPARYEHSRDEYCYPMLVTPRDDKAIVRAVLHVIHNKVADVITTERGPNPTGRFRCVYESE